MSEQKIPSEAAQKRSKIINTVVNIVVIVVVVFVAFIAISRVTSLKKGYNSLFGTAFIAVETNSMAAAGIKRGDMLLVDVLTQEEAGKLSEQDVITFKHFDRTLKAEIIITHRIVEVIPYGDGVRYITHGDSNELNATEDVYPPDVIGKLKNKIGGVGHLTLFFASKWGFFSIVVIPCLLVVLYCVFRVIMGVRAYTKEKAALEAENAMTDEDKIAALEAQLNALKKSPQEQEPTEPDDKS